MVLPSQILTLTHISKVLLQWEITFTGFWDKNSNILSGGVGNPSTIHEFAYFVSLYQFTSVQSLSPVWLFVTPWITAHQASLSITISRSSLRLTSIESVMPSSHLILCSPLLLLPPNLPASESFPWGERLQLFAWGGQSTGVSTSASFPPKKSQGLSPSEWTGWISLQSTGLSGVS